ncbi:MAG: hypothetical protein RBQ87_00270, partial [Candidatus Cloacimonadaceae bacterium]|nr:hypothetical protein [Candidatus Cloacimonadaceae bacterium]
AMLLFPKIIIINLWLKANSIIQKAKKSLPQERRPALHCRPILHHTFHIKKEDQAKRNACTKKT